MSLENYRTLGRSGLVVSPLALGTMTFGQNRWGVDEAGSQLIFDMYRAAGGNFVDTADVYADGMSEDWVGRFIRNAKARDEMVLATKFGFNASANPLAANHAGGGNPNTGRRWRKKRSSRARCIATTAENRLCRSLLDARLGRRHACRGDRANTR